MFFFGQKHNDIDCALCPTAKRACDRAWVTAKQIENWSEMSTMTLNRRLHDLEECERISRLSDLINVDKLLKRGVATVIKNLMTVKIANSVGAVNETTFYNLNVLNQLAMACIDDEIIFGNFKGKESLPLANRGNAFVSLRGVLEILSKTELSSDDEDSTFLLENRTE